MGALMTEPQRPAPAPQQPAVDYIDVFGTHVHPDEIAAHYEATYEGWVDMPEARPRSRCRARTDRVDTERGVFVMLDGSLRYDKTDVKVDEYVGDKYAAVRAEGERRWAQIDKARGRK